MCASKALWPVACATCCATTIATHRPICPSLRQVAEQAVKHAREKQIDVVLVDTAGRMQVGLLFGGHLIKRDIFIRTTCPSCSRWQSW